ncbi:hypothetical protein HDU97_007772 [Phlyctochytrium planicorne]|nr:hypothetical protein HDU97_007772 [Phlyctochytrium planicorne]
MSDATTGLLAYALKFPEAARWLWDANVKLQNYLSTLSPEVRQKVIAFFSWLMAFAVSMARLMGKVYEYVMAFPGGDPAAWVQPSPLVLKPLTGMILFLFPVVDAWEEVEEVKADGESDRIMYVANSGIFALDAIPLMAAIYQKTGKIPRRVTDQLHATSSNRPFHIANILININRYRSTFPKTKSDFKIPLWKHLIEYLGAITPSSLPAVLQAGHPLLLHPGGRRETFRLKTDPQSMPIWSPDRKDWVESTTRNNYTVIPVGIVGLGDMVRIVGDVKVDPVLWLMGEREPMGNVPVAIPKSYQKLYVFFSRPVAVPSIVLPPPPPYSFQPGFQTPVSEVSLDPTRMDEAQTRVEGCVRLAVNRATEMQLSDPKRFLLEGVWEALEGGKQVAKDLSERFEHGLQQNGASSSSHPNTPAEGIREDAARRREDGFKRRAVRTS